MGEMPDAGAPVLQIDVAELGAGADDEFDGAAVQTGCGIVGIAAGGFGKERGFGAFFEDRPECG